MEAARGMGVPLDSMITTLLLLAVPCETLLPAVLLGCQLLDALRGVLNSLLLHPLWTIQPLLPEGPGLKIIKGVAYLRMPWTLTHWIFLRKRLCLVIVHING